MSRQIVFLIDQQGDVEMEAKGFSGRSCRDATKAFEDALGGQVMDRKEKTNQELSQEVEQERLGNG